MAQLLTLTPSTLVVAGTSAVNLTAAFAALGANTGVLFVNNGRRVLAVNVDGTPTTATSQIGTTVQGQTVTGVSSGALAIFGDQFPRAVADRVRPHRRVVRR